MVSPNHQATCAGCGIQIQTRDPHQLGYTPEKALERDPLICQRCFRMKNYQEVSQVTLDPQHFLQIVSQIALEQALVIHMIDILDIEGTWISSLPRFVGKNPILLVVNKVDLLPKVTNFAKMVNHLQRFAKEQGVKIADILFISAKKNIGFERLVASIQTYKGKRNVYVVGATNVGKSSLINRLITDYSDLQADLTTSMFPGTTLHLVRIPIEDGSSIIDTPGIVYKHRWVEHLQPADLAKVTPSKPIKPMVFQLNALQTLFLGGLARCDFLAGEHQSCTFFVSNALTIHRTKLERADELYREHRGQLLAPPQSAELHKYAEWVKYDLQIAKGTQMDICISGVGWIKINRNCGAHWVIHVPKGIKVLTRPSLI